MNKESAHTHTRSVKYLLSLKKERICQRDNLEGIMLTEMSQGERDKYYMVSLTCGI